MVTDAKIVLWIVAPVAALFGALWIYEVTQRIAAQRMLRTVIARSLKALTSRGVNKHRALELVVPEMRSARSRLKRPIG